MDLFEYQGKQYLASFGVPAPTGTVAATVEAAVAGANLAGYPVAVKAQVRTGGRGKAGGIKVANDADEVRRHAAAILGMDIRGHVVERVWVEAAVDVAREYYASLTLDRGARRTLAMVSARGGVDIEQVAIDDPAAIARLHVDALDGLSPNQAVQLVADAGIDHRAHAAAADLLVRLYRAYTEGDADLVEVNPLVLTGDGHVVALDAKVTLDDNASFRHPDWEQWRATEHLDERERLAKSKGVNYVGLDGTVGVIGNGAGLVMSTVDLVTQVGGSAANFLDVGGGASADVVSAALQVVNADPKVQAILVNIFGGITRGEEVANGIVEALGRVEVASPIVVRLDGTNAEEGRAILAAHRSEKLVPRPTMLEAATTAVELAASGHVAR